MAERDMTGLAELRAQIDIADEQLLELLNKRAAISLAIGKAKASVPGAKIYDPERERCLLHRLFSLNAGPLEDRHISAIWREIMSASKMLQQPCSVAYLGPEGTFSHIAARGFLGEAPMYVPCSGFAEVFGKIHNGECGIGVVPLENSIHGTIPQSFDLFSQYAGIGIRAEFFARICNSLISNERELGNVRTVYSHAQPLGQCGRWLQSNLPHASLVPVSSTAAAALRASAEKGSAAIGHSSMAEKLGMNILAGNIEDEIDNWTRFVVIAAGSPEHKPLQAAPSGWSKIKSSLLFTVPDHPGALSPVLGVFSRYGVNMAKLESRPLKGSRWRYIFFADVECDLLDPASRDLMQELNGMCASVRVLGCYPEGEQAYASEAAGA